VHSIPLAFVCILAGIGVGTVWTNSDALVSKIADEKQMGSTMGVAGSFKEFGDMAGPLLMGIISQTLGIKYGFVVCAILGLAALLLTIFYMKVNTADDE
jgi:MFS family permease